MTLIELRSLVFDEIGLNMEQDVLTDYKLIQSWNQASKFWSRYMNPIRGAEWICFQVDDSLQYTFTGTIPKEINALFKLPNGSTVPCWKYFYIKPTITLKSPMETGEYAVCWTGSQGYEDFTAADLPEYFLWLLCAYAKRKVGQFLKFANYADKPFDIDGQQWYQEGDQRAKEVEEFIRVNRDESFNNLTDFNANRRRAMFF